MKKINWTLKNKKLSELIPHPSNPRIIKGKKFDDLKQSIQKFGMAQPIVLNTDNTILSGHARYYYLLEQKEETVDCYIPDKTFTKEEEKEAIIRFNKNIAGSWDFEILANEFEMNDLKDWGFEDHEFGQFDFGTKEQQGKLDEMGGGESKVYHCPQCNFSWTPEKKK